MSTRGGSPAQPSTPKTLRGPVALSHQSTRRFKAVLGKVSSKVWGGDQDLEAKAKPPELQGWQKTGRTLLLAFQALGVVFGDIGTSPLYVFAGVFPDGTPTEEEVVGSTSLIIYTITMIVVIKYGLIVLYADDRGQGGSFALYAQLRRQGMLAYTSTGADISRADDLSRVGDTSNGAAVNSGASTNGKTVGSGDSSHVLGELPPVPPHDLRQRIIEASSVQNVLRVMVVIGVGLIMGDGVLTPAISVVSAIEGLQTGISSLSQGATVGISLAILVGLFSIQSFGTHTVGLLFSPIMVVWFFFNTGIGLYNITQYSPSIFKALSPTFWFNYFIVGKGNAWKSLSGVLLCVTGAEALFADLGHFSRPAIQIALLCIVYPALLITYLGQGSYLLSHPEKVSTTFFASLPHGTFWPMLVVATLAAIVASQALISATFQIVSQAITQGFFPRFHVKHTSKEHFGQIYIAVINYTLMVLTLIVVATFQTSAKLGEAYGLAVVCDMLLTSIFMTLVLMAVWRVHWIFPPAFALIWGTIDTLFLSASVRKIPTGGWFSLLMASVYAYIMLLWFWGSSTKSRYLKRLRKKSLEEVIKVKRAGRNGSKEESLALLNNQKIVQQNGMTLYYSPSVKGVPIPFTNLTTRIPMLSKVVIFLTNRFTPLTEVLQQERFLVEQLGAPGFYKVAVRYGYNEIITQGPQFVRELSATLLSQLYRALRIGVAPFAVLRLKPEEHALSKQASMRVNSTLGDMMGSVHATQRSIANSELTHLTNWSTRNYSTRGHSTRTRPGVKQGDQARPSIIGESGQMVFPPEAPSAHAASNRIVPDQQEARSFEEQMKDFGELVLAKLEQALPDLRVAYPESADELERLNLLAHELVLVAENCIQSVTYVLGRTHKSGKRSRNFLKSYFLEMPFDFLLTNTKEASYSVYRVPEDALLEVGVIYEL